MAKKNKTLAEQVRAANDVLSRAFEGGFFEPHKEVWRRGTRDAARAAAREMLGELGEGLRLRLDVRSRNAYKDVGELPPGDWEKAKESKLVKVFVVGPKGETGE